MKRLIFLLLLLLFIPNAAWADGIILPPPNENINEASQKALIVHQNGVEDLILSVDFFGNASHFAWLIPVPSKPEVKEASEEIFKQLGRLTKPKKNLLDKIKGERLYMMSGKDAYVLEKEESRVVEIAERKRVGILDVTILTATSAAELENWLKENGYTGPTSVIEAEEGFLQEEKPIPLAQINQRRQIFQEYLDRGWYFVAAKIDASFLEETSPQPPIPPKSLLQSEFPQTVIERPPFLESSENLRRPPQPPQRYLQGQITPLHLTFKSQEIIYPLKISSLSTGSRNILLYLWTNNKMKVSNYPKNFSYLVSPGGKEEEFFQMLYVNKLEARNLQTWLPNLKEGYLTKLYASYLPTQQIKEDLRFVKAENNQTVNTGEMRVKDWLLVPFFLGIYGPFKIIQLFTGSGYYLDRSLPYLGFPPVFLGLIILGVFAALSLVWVVLTYLLLSKTTRRGSRLLLYLLQLPAVWVLVNLFSLIIVVPKFILLRLLNIESEVIFFDLLLKNNFGAVFFTALFYTLQAKIHRFWKKS